MEREIGDGRKVLKADGSLSSKFTKSMGCPSSPFPKRATLLRGESIEKPGVEIKKIHLQILTLIISSKKVY